MFAIVSDEGKQYKFEVGRIYDIDLHDSEEKKITFSDVLLISDEKETKIGEPTIKGATVEADFLGEIKGDKVEVFKFHAKKHYKRNNGHRQKYSKVKISSINA